MDHLWLIYCLPLFAVISIWLFRRIRIPATKEIYQNIFATEPLFAKLNLPLLFIFSSLNQLFGISTGREGVGVQMGVLLSEIFGQGSFRKRLGIACGFSAIFLTPITAAFFAFEIHKKNRNWFSFPLVWIGAVAAREVRLSFAPEFSILPPAEFNLERYFLTFLVSLLLFAVFLKLGVWLFHSVHEKFRIFFGKMNPYAAILIFSMAMIGLTLQFQDGKYNGLGFNLIHSIEAGQGVWYDFFIKLLATTSALGSGLIGGEVTPLFSLGFSLGDSFAHLTHQSEYIFRYLGQCAFFALYFSVPMAGLALGFELLGFQALFPLSLILFFGVVIQASINRTKSSSLGKTFKH